MKATDNRKHDSECAIGLIEKARKKAQAAGCKVKEVIKAIDKGQKTCYSNW